MTARFIVADVMDGLASLETGSVDLVVTSPPFLALRSYLPADHELKSKEIGSEATPAEFIDTLLRVTAELRRVLAPHGSICVELGDTYAGSGGAGGDYAPDGLRDGQPLFRQDSKGRGQRNDNGTRRPGTDWAGWPLAKSRTLIPSLYQIALAYGFNPLTGQASPAGQWRIRNVVTWARPNPPVGALGDKWRPATSDLVIACTSGKRYWDDLATRKPGGNAPIRHVGDKASTSHLNPMERGDIRNGEHPSGAPLLDYWEIPDSVSPEEMQRRVVVGLQHAFGHDLHPNQARIAKVAVDAMRGETTTTPLLDYWVIPPGGYQGSHYAVFPEELVVPCVQAMCPQRVCVTCGEPSRRIVETSYEAHSPDTIERQNNEPKARADYPLQQRQETSAGMRFGRASRVDSTLGWSDCGHDNWRPGLVLDPFAGSGTTLAVATGHGHDAVGIDIDSRNADLARDRVGPFLFDQVTV